MTNLIDMAHNAEVAMLCYSISDKYITLQKLGHHFNVPVALRDKLHIYDIGGTSVMGIKYEDLP